MPTLARLAAPDILAMLAQTSIGLIETSFVAGLGTGALAGMALVRPVVMLVQMLSAGAMGGGIRSAVSRTLGAGRQVASGLLAWHAAALGVGLGIATSLFALTLGPSLYALMGGGRRVRGLPRHWLGGLGRLALIRTRRPAAEPRPAPADLGTFPGDAPHRRALGHRRHDLERHGHRRQRLRRGQGPWPHSGIKMQRRAPVSTVRNHKTADLRQGLPILDRALI